jgi:hypothetical protein
MTSHDVERAYVAARLDHADDRLADATASMRADLDRLAESWRAGVAQQLADHEARMRKLDEDHQAWLRSLYDDGGPQPASKPARQEPQQEVSHGEPASPGPVPAGRPDPAYAAEMERAQAIAEMSMADYAAMREELGVQSPTSMNKLFRETR